MDCLSFPYSRVPKSSRLLVDYLERREQISRFYNGNPFDPATYTRLEEELRGFKTDRKTLVETLLRQNAAFGAGDHTIRNIESLRDPATCAVVTGQQVGLFSGPAFTLYKALTAVRVSQSLNERGLKTVPIFWLATEDHDLEEVAQTYALNDDYQPVHLHDAGERPAPQSPVGRVKLTEGVTQQIHHLESLLPQSDDRAQLLEDLRSAYKPGATWAHSFAQFLTRLFNRWGVVLLDPMDEAVHRLSVPIYQKALRHADDLRSQLQARSSELIRAGYHAQVHITDESTLLFAEREGNRLAVHQVDSETRQFSIGEVQTASLDELESEISRHPLTFSANVLLRPIVQDSLLPTIAYVAGPSELAYLGQAQVLYSAFGRPMPAVFPRSGFTLIDHRIERWMEKYQLAIEDVWQGKEHLGRRIASKAFAEGWEERFDQVERDLAALLARLRKDIEALDPTLIDAMGHAEEKIQYQIERLKGKMTRAALSRSEILARHEEAILRALMPEKELQERIVGGIYFLGRAGYRLLDQLLEQVPADSSLHRVMTF
ncbi:MAG TPA: bacillithiol biosynthesis cysteine-adding enzyme BshC [Terriglobia bacterium]|jgi:bacillithiol biosynthesis cysteine-adding enzyme BshC|nr:bacillithiol biosynthesis cysteine-adding enzyme BshC [Terriglobia bacterium]